jgi:transketolase
LGKLIAIYDDNGISIDGHVQAWFTDDTPKRFQAYGWHVLPNVDGHSFEAVHAAVQQAKAVGDRPSLICCKTVIGKGAPNKADSHDAHGSPLGEKEVAATRENIGWRYPPFEIPDDVYEGWDARVKGAGLERLWRNRFAEYERAHPALAAEFNRRMSGELPAGWREHATAYLARTVEKAETIATRKASQNAIEGLAPGLPELIGGSADLASSNLTLWSGSRPVRPADGGNYVFYGVREFGMTAIMTGMALHGGLIPYGGTFLTFSDYARNALRMAALIKVRSIFVFTHDSIGLGEDGPTHQPIEHAATLRYIPNMAVWRPCDSVETAAAWTAAIERKDGPTSLLLSRQNLPFVKRNDAQVGLIARGGYVLAEAQGGAPRVALLATGSEVALALDAQKALAEQGIAARVVSMPCTSVFDRQDAAYRESVLPRGLRRVAIEAGVSDFWRKYVGLEGGVVGIDRFGESAPAGELFKYFGFTVPRVVETVKQVLHG